MKRIQSTSGFTLLEVLIVVGIFAITAAIAVPGIMNWLPDYRLKGAARDLYSNMQKARSEAVKRNTNVGISFNTVVFPATGGGYTVFVDDGKGGGTAGDAVRHSDEDILFQVEMPPSCSLVETTFTSDATGYNSRGLTLRSRIGHVEIRNRNPNWYGIFLSISGYPDIRRSSTGVDDSFE
jgi:type IV fimbrial biogenesis protein FimT